MTTEVLPKIDFMANVLSPELRTRAKGRPIQVVSDFDETQASTYVFSGKWNTHVPKVRADLFQEAQRLTQPMCLATARTPSEPVSWVMWHKLSRPPMPLVAENGAVLVWPSGKITVPPKVEILASSKQTKIMRQIQQDLQDGLINKLEVPQGHEVVLRPGRVATVEIRAQEIITKKGTPQDYTLLTEQIQRLFPESIPQIDIVSSGSSLGMQPKGVSKELGVLQAFNRSGVSVDSFFFICIGDNRNDEPLFNFVRQNGGMTVGVRPSVGNVCDFTFDGGDEVSLQILKIVNSLNI